MTAVGFIACGVVKDPRLPPGNPLKLISSVDYTGRVCGYDGIVKDKPYGYYLLDRTSVCVRSCPSTTNFSEFICHYDVQEEADTNMVSAYMYLAQQKCFWAIESTVGTSPSPPLPSSAWIVIIAFNSQIFIYCSCEALHSDEGRGFGNWNCSRTSQ